MYFLNDVVNLQRICDKIHLEYILLCGYKDSMETEAQLFKALAEPVRLRILNLLLKGERCVCDIMAVLDMPQSTVSRHLAYLKNAGLINGQRHGVWMYYQLANPESELHNGLIKLLNSCLPQTSKSQKDLDALKKHVATKDTKKC